MDWTATILKTTGTNLHPAYPLEGVNLIGVCTRQRAVFERTLFWRNAKHEAMRSGTWKYLKEGGNAHLFNLTEDPGEKTDLKAEQPAAFENLKTAYQKWNSQMLPLPAPAAPAEARLARLQQAETQSSAQRRRAQPDAL